MIITTSEATAARKTQRQDITTSTIKFLSNGGKSQSKQIFVLLKKSTPQGVIEHSPCIRLKLKREGGLIASKLENMTSYNSFYGSISKNYYTCIVVPYRRIQYSTIQYGIVLALFAIVQYSIGVYVVSSIIATIIKGIWDVKTF